MRIRFNDQILALFETCYLKSSHASLTSNIEEKNFVHKTRAKLSLFGNNLSLSNATCHLSVLDFLQFF